MTIRKEDVCGEQRMSDKKAVSCNKELYQQLPELLKETTGKTSQNSQCCVRHTTQYTSDSILLLRLIPHHPVSTCLQTHSLSCLHNDNPLHPKVVSWHIYSETLTSSTRYRLLQLLRYAMCRYTCHKTNSSDQMQMHYAERK